MRRFFALLAVLVLSACLPTAEAKVIPTDTPPAPPTVSPTPALASMSGLVWHDECVNLPTAQAAPGCVEALQGPEANGTRDPGEAGILGVTIGLGLGPCPSGGLALTFTDADGAFIFNGLVAGTYCLSINPADTRNAALLLPGEWTLPRGAQTAGATIAVSEGENKSGVNFGWDYQLRPEATPIPITPTTVNTPPPLPTQKPCVNRAEFITDVTIPDNTQLALGALFEKIWRLKNTGSCDWTTSYTLVWVGGEKMNGPDSAPVPALIPPGATVDVGVTLTAPGLDGVYRGEWQLRSPGGATFGGGSDGSQRFWVQIVAGNAPTPTAAPKPAAFELGGQVAGFSAPDPMRYAGMAWVKRQVRWHPGDAADPGWINDAHAKGFKILLSVLGDPATISGGANFDAYAAFVGDLARLGADGIEVWNEMNLDREWPAGEIDPSRYADLLKRAYQQIKAANPGTLVISGAPSPTGAEGAFGLDHVWNDDRYIKGLAAAGAANFMDCVGVHYNEGVISPGQSSGDPRIPSDYYSRYYPAMMSLYFNAFLGTRKLCFTELGYLSPEGYGPLPGSFAWGADTSVAEQAQWLGEVARLARDAGKVRMLIVFNVDFTRYDDDPQAGFAIIRPGGGCPACDSLRAVTGGR